MGDDAAALRVLTCFETTDAVIENLGASLTRGSIRVPIQLKTQAPFDVVLETRSGLEAVRGSSVVIEHAGDATWIRFLSAADHQGDDARWILSDVSVVLQGSLRETTESKVKTEQFEAITKVDSEGQAIEAIRAGNAEPVPLAPRAPMVQVPVILPLAPFLPTTQLTQALKSKLDRKFDLSTGEAQPLRIAALAQSSGLASKVELGSVIVAADDLAIPVEPAAPIGFALAKPAMDTEPAPVEAAPVEIAPVEAAPVEPPVNGAPKAVITESAEPMVMEPESSTRPTEQAEPLRVEVSADAMTPLAMPPSPAMETSIASVEVHEISPIQRTPVAVLIAGLDLDPTKPNQMPAGAAHDSDREAKRRAHTDLIARERGIRPITQAPKRTELQPRQIMIVSAGVAAACMIATISTIVWARGAVSDARTERARSRDMTASAVPTPVPQPEPAIATFPSGPVPPPEPAPTVAGQVEVVEPAGDDDPGAPVESAGVKPLPEATFEYVDCAVSVSANVSGSTVFVDGKSRGTAPAEISAACDAPLAVEVRHARYESFKSTVTPSGGKLEIAATLEREKTALTVWSDPPAQVVYNGTLLGTTPLTANVPRHEQGTLRFRAKGMAPDWRRILPKSATKTVSVTLTKK